MEQSDGACVCVSYVLHVIIAILYVTKKAVTDWPGPCATSVIAGPVLIMCGVMRVLELGDDCIGSANAVKSRWTGVPTIPQTVSIPRQQSVELGHHREEKQSEAQRVETRLTSLRCEPAAYTPEVQWTSGCDTKKVSV